MIKRAREEKRLADEAKKAAEQASSRMAIEEAPKEEAPSSVQEEDRQPIVE
jgi:hypothetical protein